MAAKSGMPEPATDSVRRFRSWSPEEIWRPLEAPDYLMGGLFVRGSLGLLVAYGASLKTWMLQDACLSVATGMPWLGIFETKPGRSLLLDYEAGDYEVRRRAHRLARGREMLTPMLGFSFVTMPEWSLVDDEFYSALEGEATRCGFIGIDSLSAASGGIDENDSRFARSLYRLKACATRTGCTILVLHHARKGSGGEDSDPREIVRGTSAIFNACDVILAMGRAKVGGFRVQHLKARGGKAIEPFLVSVEDTGPGASVISARGMPEEPAEETPSQSLQRSKEAVLALLAHDHGLRTKEAIYVHLRGTKAVRVSALAELLEPPGKSAVVIHTDGTFRLRSDVGGTPF